MAKFEITAPDGSRHEVTAPDGASEQEVLAFAQKSFAPSQAQRDQVAKADVGAVPSRIGDLILGATKGAADMVQGPAQLILNGAAKLSGDGVGSRYLQDKAKQFNKHLEDQEHDYQLATPGSATAGLGRVAASTAPFMLGGEVPQATSTMGKIAELLTKGGAFGASQPINKVNQTETGDDFLKQKALQATVGGVSSVAAAPIANAAARVINPNTSPAVKTLLKENITPSMGQILGGSLARTEDKLKSVPVLGDFITNSQRRAFDDLNVAAYNRALSPIGEKSSGKVGREGVAEVKAKLGKAYDDLLPNLQFKADQQFSSEVGNLTSMIQNGNVPPEIAKQFNNIVKNEVFSRMTKQGAMDGKSFKELETALGQKIKGFGASQNPNDQEIAKALGEVLKSARDNLSRSNPKYAADLAKVNEGYANYARIRSAASSLGAEEGAFTTAQLQNAVKANDKSVGKGKFASGDALMQDLSEAGKSVLGSKYPDSGTAGRTLTALLAGGGGALAITHPMTALGMAGAGATAAAPYTALGQKLAAALLAKRPAAAKPISEAVRAAVPALAPALTPALIEALKARS